MDFLELAQKRYSVRKYKDTPVEEEKLQKILEAGRLAPTAVNYQPQKIFVLKSQEAIQKLRSVTPMAFNAPVALLVCYDKNISWKATNYGDDHEGGPTDAAIVTTMMMMEATQLGLGTLWIRGYRMQDILDAFPMPENIVPFGILLVGYAYYDGPKNRTPRKPLSETVTEL